MGSSPSLPPPPGAGSPQPASTSPTQGQSPSPAQPSPGMQQGTQMLIGVVNNLRAIAKQYPAAAPKVAEANNIMREIANVIMQAQTPGEPATPPTP